MAICSSGQNRLQEATGIRRGRVYPVAKNYSTEIIIQLVVHYTASVQDSWPMSNDTRSGESVGDRRSRTTSSQHTAAVRFSTGRFSTPGYKSPIQWRTDLVLTCLIATIRDPRFKSHFGRMCLSPKPVSHCDI